MYLAMLKIFVRATITIQKKKKETILSTTANFFDHDLVLHRPKFFRTKKRKLQTLSEECKNPYSKPETQIIKFVKSE